MDVASVAHHDGAVTARSVTGHRRLGRRPYIIVALVLAVHTLWMVFPPGGDFSAVVVSDLAEMVAAAVAGVACLTAARRVRGHRWSRGWALIGIGMLAWTVGDGVWAWYEVVLRRDVPIPSAADIGYLGMAALSLAGIANMISFRAGRLRIILDGLTISASVLFVSWATVLSPAFAESKDSLFTHVVNLSYPVSDVAMISMITLLLMHGNPRWRTPLLLLAAGLFFFGVADSVYAYGVEGDTYTSGGIIDTAWVAGFLLIALGAHSAEGTGEAPYRQESVWPLVSFIPLGAASITSAIVYSLNGEISPFLYILTLTIVVLVLTRQAITLSDNVGLNRKLTTAVRELRRREGQLSRLAFHDPLTGLANRSLFHDRVEHACAAAVRDGRAVGVLYLDLDEFKQVNDRYGHAVGDAVLVEVGRRLRDCLRPEDTMGRLGGDEFAVLVEHVDRRSDLDDLTRRLSHELSRPLELRDGRLIPLSASIGVALHEPARRIQAAGSAAGPSEPGQDTEESLSAAAPYATGGEPVSELLRRADLAMYAAKVAGKGRAVTIQHPVQSLQTDLT